MKVNSKFLFFLSSLSISHSRSREPSLSYGPIGAAFAPIPCPLVVGTGWFIQHGLQGRRIQFLLVACLVDPWGPSHCPSILQREVSHIGQKDRAQTQPILQELTQRFPKFCPPSLHRPNAQAPPTLPIKLLFSPPGVTGNGSLRRSRITNPLSRAEAGGREREKKSRLAIIIIIIRSWGCCYQLAIPDLFSSTNSIIVIIIPFRRTLKMGFYMHSC